MIGEGRIVGQYPKGILINLKPLFHGFQNHALFPIRQHPVQRRQRNLLRKRQIHDPRRGKKAESLPNRGAIPENPRYQLKRCHIPGSFFWLLIDRIAREIQSCHGQPLFIDCIRIQRIVHHNRGHSYHGIMAVHFPQTPELERILSWRQRHLFSKGILQIQVPSKIKCPIFPGDTCTHSDFLPSSRCIVSSDFCILYYTRKEGPNASPFKMLPLPLKYCLPPLKMPSSAVQNTAWRSFPSFNAYPFSRCLHFKRRAE